MKKKITRLLALLIVLSLALSMLASCALFGQQGNDEDKENTENSGGDNNNPPAPDEPDHALIVFDYGNGETETIDLRIDSPDGVKIPQPADPEKEGFIFRGWYIKGTDTPYDFDTPVTSDTEDLTFVAKWDFETVGLDALLPNDVSLLLRVSALSMTLPIVESVEMEDEYYDEEEETWVYRSWTEDIVEMYHVYINEDTNLLLGIDENGNFYATVYSGVKIKDENGNVKDAGIFLLCEEGTYYVVFSDGEHDSYGRIDSEALKASILELLNLMQLPIPVAALLSGEELPGIPAPVVVLLNKLLTFEDKKEFLLSFFSVETIEGVEVYTLDYEKIAAINEDLNTLSVSELIDKWFGEATFISISALVQKALAMKVGELFDLLDTFGIEPTDVFALILEAMGIPVDDETAAQMAAYIDSIDRNATVLSLIVAGEEGEKAIKQEVKAFLKLCDEISFYELMETVIIPMLAKSNDEDDFDGENDPAEDIGTYVEEDDGDEEYEEIGIYDFVYAVLDLLGDTVQLSFSVKDNTVAGVSLNVTDFVIELEEESLAIDTLVLDIDFDHPTYEYELSELMCALAAYMGDISNAKDFVEENPRSDEDDWWNASSSYVTFYRNNDNEIYGILVSEYYSYGYITTYYAEGEEEGRDAYWSSQYHLAYSISNYSAASSFMATEAEYGYYSFTVVGDVMREYYDYESFCYVDDPSVTHYLKYGEETPDQPEVEYSNVTSITFYYNPSTGETLTTSAYHNMVSQMEVEEEAE